MNIGFFKFQPYFKSVLWGGEKIAQYKGVSTDQKQIGESWEISGIQGRESVVSEGEESGLTILLESIKENWLETQYMKSMATPSQS